MMSCPTSPGWSPVAAEHEEHSCQRQSDANKHREDAREDTNKWRKMKIRAFAAFLESAVEKVERSERSHQSSPPVAESEPADDQQEQHQKTSAQISAFNARKTSRSKRNDARASTKAAAVEQSEQETDSSESVHMSGRAGGAGHIHTVLDEVEKECRERRLEVARMNYKLELSSMRPPERLFGDLRLQYEPLRKVEAYVTTPSTRFTRTSGKRMNRRFHRSHVFND